MVRTVARRMTGLDTARALLHHCATEMNHLAGFLPQLHEEFRGVP
ncbi:DAPG hydrolase family protein [Calidifontibacter terrae]